LLAAADLVALRFLNQGLFIPGFFGEQSMFTRIMSILTQSVNYIHVGYDIRIVSSDLPFTAVEFGDSRIVLPQEILQIPNSGTQSSLQYTVFRYSFFVI
jgi:hypothetical protein